MRARTASATSTEAPAAARAGAPARAAPRPRGGDEAGECDRGNAHPDGLQVAEQPGGEEDDGDDEAPAEGAPRERDEGREAPQRRRDVPGPLQEEGRERVARQPEEGDHDASGDQAPAPRKAEAGGDDAEADHQQSDHRRNGVNERRGEADQRASERVEECVNGPEGVEGQRPAAQGEVAVGERLPLQRDRRRIRVGEDVVCGERVEQGEQHEDAGGEEEDQHQLAIFRRAARLSRTAGSGGAAITPRLLGRGPRATVPSLGDG